MRETDRERERERGREIGRESLDMRNRFVFILFFIKFSLTECKITSIVFRALKELSNILLLFLIFVKLSGHFIKILIPI